MPDRAVLHPVSSSNCVAAPIVKWAGGKSQLLDRLVPRLPPRFGRYFEPFAGGAALFFATRPSAAVLCDTNAELINTYAVVRDEPDRLIRVLRQYRYDRDRFYKVRAQDPAALDPVRRAARFIYLNRTCFNGLYRVNRSGQFNVPFGRYTNPRICDVPRIKGASAALSGADLLQADFTYVVEHAKKGDFVYFDPPYVPRSPTSNFTSYTAGSFGYEDQRRLAEAFSKLDRRGCKLMLSNSETPLVDELYGAYFVDRVSATRNINSRGSARGVVGEVIVRNYR